MSKTSVPCKATKEQLQQCLRELDNTADALGKGIDPEIKEAVAVLNVIGFPTTASCAGHVNRALPAPWIDIAAVGEPKWRYKNQRNTFMRIANEYDVDFGELLRARPIDVWEQAMKICRKNGETKRFKTWSKKTEALGYTLQDTVNNFYKNVYKTPNNAPPNNTMLRVKIYGGNERARLYNGKEDVSTKRKYETSENVPEKQKKTFAKHLKVNRAHMQEFIDYLKENYIS